jgi:hypothetical protein
VYSIAHACSIPNCWPRAESAETAEFGKDIYDVQVNFLTILHILSEAFLSALCALCAKNRFLS